jgi:hypothetical protein
MSIIKHLNLVWHNGILGAFGHRSPNATGLERGCVQSTSRSTWKGSEASSIFQEAGFAMLLRLVFDTAALRGRCADAPIRLRPEI